MLASLPSGRTLDRRESLLGVNFGGREDSDLHPLHLHLLTYRLLCEGGRVDTQSKTGRCRLRGARGLALGGPQRLVLALKRPSNLVARDGESAVIFSLTMLVWRSRSRATIGLFRGFRSPLPAEPCFSLSVPGFNSERTRCGIATAIWDRHQ
jgi:hypothetical protein